jgi:hypothetical protein
MGLKTSWSSSVLTFARYMPATSRIHKLEIEDCRDGQGAEFGTATAQILVQASTCSAWTYSTVDAGNGCLDRAVKGCVAVT